jgi:hypothetical protein
MATAATCDLFTVPSATFEVLDCFVVMSLDQFRKPGSSASPSLRASARGGGTRRCTPSGVLPNVLEHLVRW